jgi:hypothetical protein
MAFMFDVVKTGSDAAHEAHGLLDALMVYRWHCGHCFDFLLAALRRRGGA